MTYTITQIITPYVRTVPKGTPKKYVFDDNSMRSFRKAIYTNPKEYHGKKLVLATTSKDLEYLYDLFIALKPDFDVVIRCPLVIFDESYEIETEFEDHTNNNNLVFSGFTPKIEDSYLEANKLAYTLPGKIAVLGPLSKKYDDKITYYSNIVDVKDEKNIIDTLIGRNEEYITLGRSIARYYYFDGVNYYRLASKEGYNNLPLSKRLNYDYLLMECVNYGHDPFEIFDQKKVEVFNYHIRRLKVKSLIPDLMKYNMSILPSYFMYKWDQIVKNEGMARLPGYLIALLLSNSKYIKNFYIVPTRTEHAAFDYNNKYEFRRNIVRNAGTDYVGSLYYYLYIFNKIFNNQEQVQEIAQVLSLNTVNLYILSQKITNSKILVEEYDPVKVYEKCVPILNEMYPVITKAKNNYYVDEFNHKYYIDYNRTVHSDLPDKTLALLIEDNIIYLYTI